MPKGKKGNRFASVFLLIVLPLLALVVSSFAMVQGVRYYVATSSYFKVKTLQANGIADTRYVDSLKDDVLGRNIFSLNLSTLSEAIQRRFPTLCDISVTRVLPSGLLVVARERTPVAALQREANYLLDACGVAVASAPLGEPLLVPVIVGLENQVPRVKIGAAYAVRGLDRALSLAVVLRERGGRFTFSAGLLKDVSVEATKIDASDAANICFYLNNTLQVKMGDRDFSRRLALLPAILRSIGPEGLAGIRYIDLRLREPVIATKDGTAKK